MAVECRAWGDPHVITFDGAQNDVYGVGEYILVQSKAESKNRHFRVRIETEKWGAVSVVSKAFFDFQDSNQKTVATVVTDRFGNSDLVLGSVNSEPLAAGKSGVGYDFKFSKNGKRIGYKIAYSSQLKPGIMKIFYNQ